MTHKYFDCISVVPGQWSESLDTRRGLYTGRISRPLSRFNDGLCCLMLMASLTLRLLLESSDVNILVFSILCPVCVQCSNIAKLDLAIYSLSPISRELPVSPM